MATTVTNPRESVGRRLLAAVGRYRSLLIALVLVYLAMTALSAVKLESVRAHPFSPGQWEKQRPVFLVQQADSGPWRFNSFNQRKILEQGAINLTLGVGMTFVILTGGIDLSVGSLLALCNVVFVQVVLAAHGGGPASPTILLIGMTACVATGIAVGMANGWLSVSLGLPSFIVTLGTMFVAKGLAYWVSGGHTQFLACPEYISIAIPIGVSLLAVVVAGIFLGTTTAGRRIFAVGGNLLASEYSGVRTGRVRIMCFAFSGLCAGLAGMIYWSRVGTGSHLAGETRELYAIAVVVLGGTRLAGGEGSIVGTLIGALIITVLANGLNASEIDQNTQKFIVGCVLIVAAYIDSRRGRSSGRAVM